MRSSSRPIFTPAAGMAVLAVGLCGVCLAAAPAETTPSAQASEPAQWTPRESRFVYLGFTSKYSCDGLRDKVTRALLMLGARRDLQVSEMPCSGSLGRPTPFPGVTLKMNVLEPLGGKSASDAAASVPAHWKRVDLTLSRDPLDASGDCDLIEQIKAQILPLFATRSVDYKSTCIPYQLTLGGTRLVTDVLVADEERAKPAATPPPGH